MRIVKSSNANMSQITNTIKEIKKKHKDYSKPDTDVKRKSYNDNIELDHVHNTGNKIAQI